MPDLPTLTIGNCPDPACQAPLGAPHHRDCGRAICISDGIPRIHHLDHPAAVGHECGAAVWTGLHTGEFEAVEAGLYVRLAGAGDAPLTGWLPCTADEPGAVPDLHRVLRSGRWNRDRQLFELPARIR